MRPALRVLGGAVAAVALLLGCAGKERVKRVRQPAVYPFKSEDWAKNTPFRAQSQLVELPVRGRESKVPNRVLALYDVQMELAWISAQQVDDARRQVAKKDRITTEAEERQLAMEAEGHNVAQEATEGPSIAQGRETGSVGQGRETGTIGQGSETAALGQAAEGGTVGQGSAARVDRSVGEGRVRASMATKAMAVEQARSYLRSRSEALARMIEQDYVLKHLLTDSKARFLRRVRRDLRPLKAVVVEKEALDGEGKPLLEIVPGETFTYRLRVRNTSRGPLMNVVVLDDFPRELQFEVKSEQAALLVKDERRAMAKPPLAFLTPNQWEEGKLAWILEQPLQPGEAVELSFLATYYESEGVPCASGDVLPRVKTDDGQEIEVTAGKDTVLVALDPSRTDTPDLRVSVRRVGGERVDGTLARACWNPKPETDATDYEKRIMATVYASWKAKE